MATPIKYTVTGDKELNVFLEKLVFKIETRVADTVYDLAQEARESMKSEAPEATGKLKGSVDLSFRRTGNKAEANITPKEDYAIYVELGRGADKAAPPVSAIRAWINAKGGNPQLARYVAQKIGQRGIEPNPFVERAFNKISDKAVPSVLKAIVSAING